MRNPKSWRGSAEEPPRLMPSALESSADAAGEWDVDARMAAAYDRLGAGAINPPRPVDVCEHQWEEQPGEPARDVCFHCGAVRE
jgi:hypothetical protein